MNPFAAAREVVRGAALVARAMGNSDLESILVRAVEMIDEGMTERATERDRGRRRRTARPPDADASSLSLLFDQDQRESKEGEPERESGVQLCAEPARPPDREPTVAVTDLLTDELSSIAMLPECGVRDLAHHWRTFCARYAGKILHSQRAGPWTNWLCKGRKWDLDHTPAPKQARPRVPDWVEEHREELDRRRREAVPATPEFRAMLARLAKPRADVQTEPNQAQGA